MRVEIDDRLGIVVVVSEDGRRREHPFASPEAFAAVSSAWLRCGWDAKYVYSFTWLGRPIIQLPEDLLRVQEIIHGIIPDVIVETGIAHGGSLVFYASLLKAMGGRQVIGIDNDIRPHNRAAIKAHSLFSMITMIEGSSIDPAVVRKVSANIGAQERVFVILDSNHTKAHVLDELRAYGPLVTPGSFIVASDGIMANLVGAPRSSEDWSWNNPRAAAEAFVAEDPRFAIEELEFAFNEGVVAERVTYWPGAYVRRHS